MNLSYSTGAIGKTCWNVTHPLKSVSLQKVENKARLKAKQVQLSFINLHALSLIIEYLHRRSLRERSLSIEQRGGGRFSKNLANILRPPHYVKLFFDNPTEIK